MATIQADFDSYKIWYYSGFHYEALIYFYKDKKYVGRIAFFKDGNPIPPNIIFDPFNIPSNSAPSIHYPLSRFNDVANMLKEEKPLYLFLNIDNKIGILATTDFEPVGEEEGK